MENTHLQYIYHEILHMYKVILIKLLFLYTYILIGFTAVIFLFSVYLWLQIYLCCI